MRTKLTIEVDLDRLPGAFHTKEDAMEAIERILEDRIPHYNPIVTY